MKKDCHGKAVKFEDINKQFQTYKEENPEQKAGSAVLRSHVPLKMRSMCLIPKCTTEAIGWPSIHGSLDVD